ncbi:MAG TPA: DoxX family protein [Thermoanaerobaculia bacterium]
MEVAFLIGRIVVAIYYISAGLRHFTHLKMMAPYAASKGVPAASVAVPFSGALLVAGGALIGLGFYPAIGAICILVFLLPTSVMMHNFWSVQDPMQKMGEMVNFTKNVGLMGYTLMILAIPQPWPFSVGR